MKPLLVLRPQPGADDTAARAANGGLNPRVFPLFEIKPTPWSIEAEKLYDAIFITSSNTLKFSEKNIDIVKNIPTLCVGEKTAKAARDAGFSNVLAGQNDAASLAELAASLGYRHLLWLCGRPSIPVSHPDLRFDIKIVYEMIETEIDGQLDEMLKHPCVALLHSPRAAQKFAELALDHRHIDIVAISEKAAIAAGPGWASVQWPDAPSDAAMLEIAAPLCRAG